MNDGTFVDEKVEFIEVGVSQLLFERNYEFFCGLVETNFGNVLTLDFDAFGVETLAFFC